MLLSKNEKKWNLVYLSTLILSVCSFYLNVLNNYKFFIATSITLALLLVLNFFRYNTFNSKVKKTLEVIYYIFFIWIISNKIYFTFYGDFINFARIFSASAPSIIASAIFNVLKSVSLLSVIAFSSLNLWTLKKSKFRFKGLYFICIPIIAISLAAILIFRAYNYEIISYMFTSSIDTGFDADNYKPITSTRENMFGALQNKKHKDNSYTGIAKDRNIILVQCESFQNMLVNKKYNNGTEDYEITPNFNKLIKNDSLYFNNCISQIGWGNTSDAEFVVNNSFYPLAMQSIYQRCVDGYFYGLPKLLKKSGYSTSVYHGYVANMWNRDKFYPVEGYENYYHSENYPTNQFIGFGIADKEFFNKTSSYIKEKDGKTFSFIITLSSHTPYQINDSMSDIKLSANDSSTMFGRYVVSINYLDSAIGSFIQDLKDKGLYDNSIIVFYGDHHGLIKSDPDNNKNVSAFLKRPYNYNDMINVPLLVHIPGLGESETIETTCGQMDIMPTILNMVGIKNDTIYFGEDLMNPDLKTDRAIGGNAYLPVGSFIDDKYIFEMPNDGVASHAIITDKATGKILTDLSNRDELYKKSVKLQDDIKLSNTITEKGLLNALLNNDSIILNDVNPQAFIYNINTDDDKYDYIKRLKDAKSAGYNLVSVKVFKGADGEFYVNNPINIEHQLLLLDFLSKIKEYGDMYTVISYDESLASEILNYLGKQHPKLASYVIPEVYSFNNYNTSQVYNLNSPILCLDNLNYTIEELIDLVDKMKLFAVYSSSDKFKPNYINALNKSLNTFTYVKDVDDEGEVTYYKDRSVKGFYTNKLDLVKTKKIGISRFK